jgi:Rod binding domain-containing protein
MTTLPPVDNATLPAAVRNGSAEDKSNYKAALQFERQLVEQLTETMAKTTGDSDEKSSSATSQQYKQMLPGVMADAVMGSGGLGLARTIAENLKATGTGA